MAGQYDHNKGNFLSCYGCNTACKGSLPHSTHITYKNFPAIIWTLLSLLLYFYGFLNFISTNMLFITNEYVYLISLGLPQLEPLHQREGISPPTSPATVVCSRRRHKWMRWAQTYLLAHLKWKSMNCWCCVWASYTDWNHDFAWNLIN